MATILFSQIVYGPVQSRRLGISLGVNLSPLDGKRCTFDCIYCECGLNTAHITSLAPPSRVNVAKALTEKLTQLRNQNVFPDRITFSGNGEPTMHPDFAGIIDDTLTIRNRLCPTAKVTVLTNSTMLFRTDVVQALGKIDENLMKFDAATDTLIHRIDQPVIKGFTVDTLVEHLRCFNGQLTIQTIFLNGTHNGLSINNTNETDVDIWIEALKKIRPQKVMIYTINRETPVKTLQKISLEMLEKIAAKVEKAGFAVSFSA